ncbi:MAG: type II secretion system protein [Desulfobacteraceae bacterium]|nr:type II secretion system protein [Desulfobacteraceae bacterium]MBC2718907.1 type II secretion system protein [Desulfobacteraceae bacterium]
MIKKISKKFKKVNSQKGFTLLEILVVLTIMGFLIAMVAPRLAGIGGSAVDTVCDTNQNRMMTYLSTYYQDTNGSLPNNLTNIVNENVTAANSYEIPKISDGDPDTGAEVLAEEFDDRNHFVVHYLNNAEVAELAGLGIDSVFNLNDYTQSLIADLDQGSAMQPTDLAENVGVAMVGIGCDTDAAADTFNFSSTVTDRDWGEPSWLGRIVFGLGPECGLITSGIIINAAHCPGGLQNTDNATYNDYNIVIPRLEATTLRMGVDGANLTASGLVHALGKITAISYDGIDLEAINDTGDYIIATNTAHFKVRDFNLLNAQEGWEYSTQCPEGHMYPEDDGEFWAFDTDGGGV